MALQRHLDATAERVASDDAAMRERAAQGRGGAAGVAATPSDDLQGLGAHDSWAALYSLGGGEAYQATDGRATNVRDVDRPADFRGYYVDSMASFM